MTTTNKTATVTYSNGRTLVTLENGQAVEWIGRIAKTRAIHISRIMTGQARPAR